MYKIKIVYFQQICQQMNLLFLGETKYLISKKKIFYVMQSGHTF